VAPPRRPSLHALTQAAETTSWPKTAGIEAGAWYAWASTHARYELGAAGMLIMGGGHDAKPMDCDAVERWARVGYERGMRFRKSANSESSGELVTNVGQA
jgi:hypothetical protein